jgi:hypothetical protein
MRHMDYAPGSWPCSPMYQCFWHLQQHSFVTTRTSRRAHQLWPPVVARTSRGRGCQQLRLVPSTWRPGRLWSRSGVSAAGINITLCRPKAGRIGRRSDAQAAAVCFAHALVTCQVHRKMGRPGNTACDSFDAVRPRVHECQDRVTVDAHIWLVCQNPALQRQGFTCTMEPAAQSWSWLCPGVLTNAINFGVNHPRNVSICPTVLTHKEQLCGFELFDSLVFNPTSSSAGHK